LNKEVPATAVKAVLFCLLPVLLLAACQATAEPLPFAPSATLVPASTVIPVSTPEPRPTATAAACRETRGRLETQELVPGLAPYPIPVQVYLPPCYDPLEGTYPVLYLLHGQSDTADLWLRMGIQSLADDLITSGQTAPFVIVLPTEPYYLQDFTDSIYGQAFVTDLLPWVEGLYAVSTERSCRAIGGISRGAAWAALLGMENWQQFGAIGAHSVPNAPYSESRLKYLLEDIPAGNLPRVWLDSGNLDRYRKSAQAFDELLTRRGVDHEWHLNEGAHEEAYWQAHLEDYLRWYAAPWGECVKAP
jgi:enterochelin esterase-like enzyme